MGAASTIPSSSSATTERIDSSWYSIDRTDDIAREAAIEALLNSGELTPELILQLAQTRLDDLDSQVQSIMAAMATTTENARAAGARLSDLRDMLTAVEPGLDANGELSLDTELTSLDDVEQSFNQFVAELVDTGELTQEEADRVLNGTLEDLLNGFERDGDWDKRGDISGRFSEAGFSDAGEHALRDHVRMTPPTVSRYLDDMVASGRITPEERAAIVAGGRDAINNLVSDANTQMSDINSQNEMMMIKLQSAMQNRTTILTSTTNLLKAMDEGNDAIVANLR